MAIDITRVSVQRLAAYLKQADCPRDTKVRIAQGAVRRELARMDMEARPPIVMSLDNIALCQAVLETDLGQYLKAPVIEMVKATIEELGHWFFWSKECLQLVEAIFNDVESERAQKSFIRFAIANQDLNCHGDFAATVLQSRAVRTVKEQVVGLMT
ncbi:MAG: hypothetical protein ABIE84_06040, partial [bacterium]